VCALGGQAEIREFSLFIVLRAACRRAGDFFCDLSLEETDKIAERGEYHHLSRLSALQSDAPDCHVSATVARQPQ